MTSEMKDKRPRVTTFLLSDDDLEALRDLAQRRVRLKGGRVSQGGVIRDLIRAESQRAKAREAARA